MVNASTVFIGNDLQEMEDLVSINKEIKALEDRKKKLTDKVKQNMLKNKLDKIDVNGSTISIIESTRRTVTKSTKDEFIAKLVGMGKKHLIAYAIEPDLDGIFAEVDTGTINKDFVDQYVQVTPVTTLRCN